MITNLEYTQNIQDEIANKQINPNKVLDLVIKDQDLIEFTYKGLPFSMQISDIQIYDPKKYVEDFNNRAEAIEICTGILPKTDKQLEFKWSNLISNPSFNDAFQLVFAFPNLWFFDSEIVENEEESIIIYSYMQEDEKVYSLTEPTQEAQKTSLNFNQNAYQIFEGLEGVVINFTACSAYIWASVKSENVFLRDKSMSVNPRLTLGKLTPTTNENFSLFFDINFSCLILEERKALFTIGNIQFEYEY